MEDISMILNTGDVPNLYGSEERAEIIEKMQNIARNEVSIESLSRLQLDVVEFCDKKLLILQCHFAHPTCRFLPALL